MRRFNKYFRCLARGCENINGLHVNVIEPYRKEMFHLKLLSYCVQRVFEKRNIDRHVVVYKTTFLFACVQAQTNMLAQACASNYLNLEKNL